MPRVQRASAGRRPGRLVRARRTIVNYVATCKGCDELPASPSKATAHATARKHVVVETKSYLVEVPEQ